MKNGWEIRKFGDVVNIINGRNQSLVISQNGEYPIYGSAGNLMGYASEYICNEGTTIIGRKGNISTPIFISEKFWNVDTAFGLYPKNGYDPKFIYYLCSIIDFKKRNRGTTIPSLVKSDLLNIDVPFNSSLPEQQRIVSILDEAFAAIARAKANAEQNLKNAKELFESYLQRVFEKKGDGWEAKRLGEVIQLISGQHIDAKDYNTNAKGIGYLTGPADFGRTFPVVSKWTEFPKRSALKGDILITVKGSGVGKINLMKENELCISRQLMAIRPIGVNTSYLYRFLSLKYNYFQSLSNGAAIPGISREDVLNLEISVPGKIEQQAIVRKLDVLNVETQKLESIIQKKIEDLEELKKSILQKAFAGELKVREVLTNV